MRLVLFAFVSDRLSVWVKCAEGCFYLFLSTGVYDLSTVLSTVGDARKVKRHKGFQDLSTVSTVENIPLRVRRVSHIFSLVLCAH